MSLFSFHFDDCTYFGYVCRREEVNKYYNMLLVALCNFILCQALESLNKKDMTEIKSYGRPPVLVEKVMQAVMILRCSEPTWTESKKQLG